MNKKTAIEWNLRLRMAEHACSPPVTWCRCWPSAASTCPASQVYRLVTSTSQRLSTDVLAALCDILDCTPNDLITVAVVNQQVTTPARAATAVPRSPARRTTIRRPNIGQ